MVEPFCVNRPIGPIRLIGPIFLPYRPSPPSPPRPPFPKAESALAQKIFVVEQQLVETSARDAHETELGLARRCERAAALGDVLPAAPRRLHHLVARARALVDEARAEIHGRVVDDLCDLKRAQPAIAAVGAQSGRLGFHRRPGKTPSRLSLSRGKCKVLSSTR